MMKTYKVQITTDRGVTRLPLTAIRAPTYLTAAKIAARTACLPDVDCMGIYGVSRYSGVRGYPMLGHKVVVFAE